MYKRILVPLDGSRFGEQALPRALSLASSAGAAIEIATVALPAGGTRPPVGVAAQESREKSVARVKKYLDAVEERVRASGFEGELRSTALPAGNVVASLARHVGETGADLAVMTTHGRGPLQRAWLGSTADGFIRHAPCPVLLLRPRGEEAEGDVDLAARPQAFSQVLVPLDGSEAAERLLPVAEKLTGDGAALRLLRVVAPATSVGYPSYLPHVVEEEHEHQAAAQSAEAYLEDVAKRLRKEGRDVEARVEAAPQTAQMILDAAEQGGVDLVAMSTEGRGGVARLLLGSVADKVVRNSRIPVLVYRRPEEA